MKFPEKERHQLFFEPEALDSNWIYPNGISTSLPPEVQEAFLRTVSGCENVKFARHGYAVEYDCIDPRQLSLTLEALHLSGLFIAGQMNGTSGYEEAAAQGLLAGINAALRSQAAPPFLLGRSEGYIGVMVDDLTSLGASEPYRMFTSRAEFRLSLREDNADLRLTERAFQIGLVPRETYDRFSERRERLRDWRRQLEHKIVKPSPEVHSALNALGSSPLAGAQSAAQLLRRPEVGLMDVIHMAGIECADPLAPDFIETLEVELKYEGYIEMQRQEISRLAKMQELAIPPALDFGEVIGLSVELREKLTKQKPKTIADAARVSGITPAGLSALLFHVKQKGASLAARPV